MKTQKMSFDIDDELYMTLKRDALEQRMPMSEIIRKLLQEKYGVAK